MLRSTFYVNVNDLFTPLTFPVSILLRNLVAGKILVLEPRRLAARLAAERVANELGEECGKQVGFQIRYESKESAQKNEQFF